MAALRSIWCHICIILPAEIGDKTQIATVALAARFDSIFWVTAGTTLGMLLANVPAVFIGDKLAHKLPIALIHKISAFIFLAIGIFTIVQHYFSKPTL